MIPEFDEHGNLPPGIHHATWTAAQMARYGGELYPADWAAEPGGMRFRDYFQRDAIAKQPKGIIAIDLSGLQ